jgi:hypothetical protein
MSVRGHTAIAAVVLLASSTETPAPQVPAAADEDVFERLNKVQEQVSSAAPSADHLAAQQPWSPDLVIYLSTSILLMTALALILGSVLLWKRSYAGQDILRLYGVVIIVGLSALLLVAGFSNDQLTPIVGLFGAIAGYLLGKDSKPTKGDE